MALRLTKKMKQNWLPALLGLALTQGAFSQDQVKKSVDTQTTTVDQNQASQKKIDTVADEATRLLDEYKLVIGETETLETYNDQLAKLVVSQSEEAASIEKQIEGIEVTNREVVPLMVKMIEGLEKFVELDVPFLLKERRQRVASLKEMMDRADVSTSEKFRRVLEAYQVENEYGRSIEAYSDTVEIDGQQKTADFLRIGRVVLIQQTLDGKVAKAWEKKSNEWKELEDRYRVPIREGIKIAKKQSAPDLITLPVPAPEASQ